MATPPTITVGKIFVFRQNNSGGSFDIEPEKGIGPRVFIEACDYDHAMQRAEEIGLYFNGVESGADCPCCGDRWSEPWDEEGSDVAEINPQYDFSWFNAVFLHRLDGTIETFRKEDIVDMTSGLAIQ